MQQDTGPHVDDYNASFKDTVWLQSFPLTPQTVMHYFALSPFYDRTCNNEKLKMQRLEVERLKTLRGIEYETLPSPTPQPNLASLFLIRKNRRLSPNQVKPLAVYYILDGTVYQAPNLHAMLTSRLKKCTFRVNDAFHGLAKGVRHLPTEGYAWDFSTDDKKHRPIPSEQIAQRLKLKQEQELEQAKGGARIESILVGILKKYIPKVVEDAESKKEDDASSKDGDTTKDGDEPTAAKRQRVE